MSDNQPTSLNCPACGAPLDFDGKGTIVRCKFCRNVSVVPGALRANQTAPSLALDEIRHLLEQGDLTGATRQYIALFGANSSEARSAVDALRAGRLAELADTDITAQEREKLTRVLEEVQRLLASGKKVEAIKQYRVAYDVSLARAKYAIDQIEAGQTEQPEAGFPTLKSTEARDAQASRGFVPIVVLFSVLVIAIIILIALFSPGGPFRPRVLAYGPTVLLSGEDQTSSKLVTVLQNLETEARYIGQVEAGSGKLAWKTDTLPGDGYVDGMAADSEHIYAAAASNLLAYRRSDGSLAWQAQMPDRLEYSDQDLQVISGRVLTMNADRSLQAYDAGTGELVWNRRLKGYDRSLRLINGLLVILDYVGDTYTYSLIYLDPQNGQEQLSFTPGCPTSEYSSDYVEPDSGLFFDQTENAVYLVFASSSRCVQRLDFASGKVVWQTILEEDSVYFSPAGVPALMTQDTLYVSRQSQILAVDKASGSIQVLASDPDYDLLPMAVDGGSLLVRAKRTRGTPRFEIRGLDAASGRMLWTKDLGSDQPIDPPDEMAGLIDSGDTGWTWHMLPSGLELIEFQGEPNQIIIETLAPSSGASLGSQKLAMEKISGDFYSVPDVIGWQGPRVYLYIDVQLYVLDLDAGRLRLIY